MVPADPGLEGGRLRGCRGSARARAPLLLDVVANAYRAGFEDPRFGRRTAGELADAALGVSVLSNPRPAARHSAKKTTASDGLEAAAPALVLAGPT